MNFEGSALIDLSWIGVNRTDTQWDSLFHALALLGNSNVEKARRKAVLYLLLSPESGQLQDLYLLERLFEFEHLIIDKKACESAAIKIPKQLSKLIIPITPSNAIYIKTAKELCQRINEIPNEEKETLRGLDYLSKTGYFDRVWEETQEFPSEITDSGISNDWIRAIFYLIFSRSLGSLLMLSGTKSKYLSTISRVCTSSQHDVIRNLFDTTFSKDFMNIHPDTDALWTIHTDRTPPILEYALEQSIETNTDAFEVILSLRESRQAKEYRRLLSELRKYSEGSRSDRIEAAKISKSLSKIAEIWSESLDINYGINYVPRTIKLKKLPLIGSILEMAGMNVHEIKDRLLTDPPGYLVFIASWYMKGFRFGDSDGILVT